MLERKLVVGAFQCNCRLLVCERTGQGVLVDPGDEPVQILDALKSLHLPSGQPIQIKYLFHTHGHLDHIGGTREVKEGLNLAPKIALHREDEPMYQKLQFQGKFFGMNYLEPLPIDHYFEHEEEIKIGDLKFSVIHTPGHSPGSVCLRLHEDSAAGSRETVFSGDTLFQGGVGRTDLWGASADAMFASIKNRLLVLDGDTRLCPGHGADSTIGIEKREIRSSKIP